MFQNYLITALRNFTRHKLYSFINIAGLTVGLTCAIFIMLFVRDELSYDKWIPGSENLYRTEVTWHIPGQPPQITIETQFPVPDVMRAQIPEVKAAVHLERRDMTVSVGDRQFPDQVNVVSPNFFQIIRLPLLAGDASTVLANAESAVLSESGARKYFGSGRAMGKILHVVGGCDWDDAPGCRIREASVIVTGIMRDLPRNTQLAGDVFIPNTSAADPMTAQAKARWNSNTGFGYVQLQPNADPRQVLIKLNAVIDRSYDPRKTQGVPMRGSLFSHYRLTPFRDDHLSTDRIGPSMTPAGDWATVYGFVVIAILIVLVACFNFTNLATARAMMRAREISLRKVMGALRSQVMVQFLGESVLTVLFAFLLALSLCEVLLPIFDRVSGKSITIDYLADWSLLLSFLGLAILVGLIAGLYPALVLSGFRPAIILRAKTSWHAGSGLVRTALVIMQFAVSIGLGIAATVVLAQISYARSIDLGLSKNGIVVVNLNGMTPGSRQSFTHALNANSALQGAAESGDVPFSGNVNNSTIEIPGQSGTTVLRGVSTDPNFFSLYHIRLLSGRSLSDAHGEDMRRPGSKAYSVVINEAAARRFGYTPFSALGKRFYFDRGSMQTARKERATIVGVTRDFKFEGDRLQIEPTVYTYDPENMGYVSVKVPARSTSEALSAIDRTWRAFLRSIACLLYFLDSDFEREFQADEQQSAIFNLFVGIAIFIACLGLFGLAAF